ncbi:MAG TPA: TspO/MBR family protein [Dermatophilaceae bacterium]|nr:TspO/MBR family protein [Dermatophilaceae bacterium]
MSIDTRHHTDAPTRNDRLRQLGVTAAEVFCVVGTLFGVGVLGTRVEESSGGALSSEATLLAPAGPAFTIWSVIYLGLAAYTVWQWLPGQTTSARHRAIGWLAAASMVLNAAWLLVTQVGWIWVSVLVILALTAVLGLLVTRLAALPAETAVDGAAARSGSPSAVLVERVVVDGTFGAYLGWVCVAACANITAALVASGVRPGSPVADIVAVVVIAVAAAVGVVLAQRLGGRLAVAVAIAWGLSWIAVGRLSSDPRSSVTAVAAVVAAAVVLAATIRQRGRSVPA